MISKHIACKPENDNYRGLAMYVGGNEDKEKIFARWCAGFNNDEDFKQAISTVAATQAMNTRSGKEKTYHLMVSFRPEDNHKLTLKILHDIESRFAAALGLDNYQRHCGVHHNTGNLHLHVAYNLIHPEKFTRHEPYNDYYKRHNLCRELEKEYGFAVDACQKDKSLSGRAASMEAFSGKQSFAGYCLEQREAILAATSSASSWEHVHQTLAQYGIAIKPHGNGLILQAVNNSKFNMKASAFERGFSKSKLEMRFGVYRKMAIIKSAPTQQTYQARPITKSALFTEYLRLRDEKRALSASIKEKKQKLLAENKNHWQAQRAEINFMPLTKKDRYSLIAHTYAQEKSQRQNIMKTAQNKYSELKERFPYNSWKEFYHHNKHREQTMKQQQEQTQQLLQPIAKPIYRWQTQHAPDKGLTR